MLGDCVEDGMTGERFLSVTLGSVGEMCEPLQACR
jgi:hypothetical protein